ncbi:MAG: hypothetical protein WA210_04145 [Burkholderiaceae bacterium]
MGIADQLAIARKPTGTFLLAFGLYLATFSAIGASSSPWSFLPARALEIEGGAVSFQGAVIVDTRQELRNPLFQDYPTNYILPVTNESDFPVWVEIEWRVPGEQPFPSSGKLEPKEYGVFFVRAKSIQWNTPIPVSVAIYADKDKRMKLGGRDVVLLFREDAKEKEAFLASAGKVNSVPEKMAIAHGKKAWMPVLPGFQEMIDMSKPVPGTAADTKLAEDIRLALWKSQSRRHWDCGHEILDAQRRDPGEVAKGESLSTRDQQILVAARARGDIAFEEWRIKSCSTISTYLVLLGKSPQGGTDVVAVKIKDSASP